MIEAILHLLFCYIFLFFSCFVFIFSLLLYYPFQVSHSQIQLIFYHCDLQKGGGGRERGFKSLHRESVITLVGQKRFLTLRLLKVQQKSNNQAQLTVLFNNK
jgi:hypothetical protein